MNIFFIVIISLIILFILYHRIDNFSGVYDVNTPEITCPKKNLRDCLESYNCSWCMNNGSSSICVSGNSGNLTGSGKCRAVYSNDSWIRAVSASDIENSLLK